MTKSLLNKTDFKEGTIYNKKCVATTATEGMPCLSCRYLRKTLLTRISWLKCHRRKKIRAATQKLRSTLQKHRRLSRKVVSMYFVREAFNLDKENVTLKAMPKLMTSHLNPNGFEKMRVSPAFQLFGDSVLRSDGMLWSMRSAKSRFRASTALSKSLTGFSGGAITRFKKSSF
ncbi:hypothetical protein MTO96_027908 [Rhipicephalus appendiculatus]